MQHACCLHRVYTDGAVTDLLRSGVATVAECEQWDAAVLAFWEHELGRAFTVGQRHQFFLPLKLGGCGFQSATWRRAPALVGSWELCFQAVAQALASSSAAAFRDACPRVEATLVAAAAEMALPGAQARFEWTKLFGAPARRRQRALAAAVHDRMHTVLRASLSEADRADLLSAGGAGAGLFLLPPEDESHVMSDEYFAVSMRRRLRCSFAARYVAPTMPTHCNHRPHSGVICGAPLDARDLHASTCERGGGFVQRHNTIRDWLATWLERFTGRPTATEAFVPAWDRPVVDAQGQPVWVEAAAGASGVDGEGHLVDAQGHRIDTEGYRVNAAGERIQKVERAKLDVTFIDGDGRRAYADVAVTSAATSSAVNLAKRASAAGAAAGDMVRTKRSKYPAAKSPATPMVPFVVEALGRLSPEANDLLNAVAPADQKVRSKVLRTAKQTLSVLVQTGLAELLLSAEPGRGLAAPAAAA